MEIVVYEVPVNQLVELFLFFSSLPDYILGSRFRNEGE
jgi:hypothetical protein